MPKNVYRLLLLLTTVTLLASVPTIAKANAYEATAQDDLFRNAPDDQYVIVSSGGGYFTSRDENRVKQDNPIGFLGQKGVGESTVGESRKLFKEHGVYTDMNAFDNLTTEEKQLQVKKRIAIFKQLAKETNSRHRIHGTFVERNTPRNQSHIKKTVISRCIDSIKALYPGN